MGKRTRESENPIEKGLESQLVLLRNQKKSRNGWGIMSVEMRILNRSNFSIA